MAYDKVLICPPGEDLIHAMTIARIAANAGGRQRTITRDATHNWTEECLMRRDGAFDSGGEGVPNSYRGRAETSLLGLAWWTDPHGRKHVRIYGGRVTAPRSSMAQNMAYCFPPNAHPAVKVYLGIQPRSVFQYEKKGKRKLPDVELSLLLALEGDPLDVAAASALVDYYQDTYPTHGIGVPGAQRRLAILQRILQPEVVSC